MTINSRAKGARGEREFAEYLRDHGWAARRGQQFSGSPDSPDVVCDIPGVHWEVKRVEKGSLYAWLNQACMDSSDDTIPIVAHRRNNMGWVAILPMGYLMELLRGRGVDLRLVPEGNPTGPEEGDGGSTKRVVATIGRRRPRSGVQ